MKKRKKIQIFRLEDRVLFEGAAAAEAVATVSNAGNPSHADKPAPGQEAKDNVQKDAVHDVVQAAGPVSDPSSSSSSSHTAPNAPVQDHGAGLPSADHAAADPTTALVDGTAHLAKLTDPGESFSTDLSDFLHSDLSSHSTSSALFSSSLPADADHANADSLSHAETKQLIVIEADAADNVDPHTLEGKDVLVLKKDADTSAQIDAYLEAHGDVKYDAIQIVSSKAEKALSSSDLTADALAEIHSHLTDHGALGFVDAADFNADPANAPHDLSHDADSNSTDNMVVFPDHETNVTVDATTELTTGVSDTTTDTTVPESLLENADAESHELVIVNSNMADLDNVLSQLGDSRDVLIIDVNSTESATQQIQDYLDAHSDTSYDSVHILTHGSSSGFNLGNTVVSDASDMAVFNGHLTQDGDIMIYGCNLASTEAGQHLINDIADVTGADVAASTDMTGAAAVGGNWTLEYASGTIETTSISLNSSWNHRLQTYNVNGTSDHANYEYSSLDDLITSGDLLEDGNDTINITITDSSLSSVTFDANTLISGSGTLTTNITITAGDTVTLSIAALNGNVSGGGNLTINDTNLTGSVTVTGDVVVTSGSVSGAISGFDSLNVTGGIFGGTITNDHTATISGGTFNGAVTNNGTVDATGGTFINTFTNNGTFNIGTVSGSTSTVIFNTSGTAIANSGVLNVGVSAANTATLDITVTGGSTATGISNSSTGTVNIGQNGIIDIANNATTTAYGINNAGGDIVIDGTLNVANTLSGASPTSYGIYSTGAGSTIDLNASGTMDFDTTFTAGNAGYTDSYNRVFGIYNSAGTLNLSGGTLKTSDTSRDPNRNYFGTGIYNTGTINVDASVQNSTVSGFEYGVRGTTVIDRPNYADGNVDLSGNSWEQLIPLRITADPNIGTSGTEYDLYSFENIDAALNYVSATTASAFDISFVLDYHHYNSWSAATTITQPHTIGNNIFSITGNDFVYNVTDPANPLIHYNTQTTIDITPGKTLTIASYGRTAYDGSVSERVSKTLILNNISFSVLKDPLSNEVAILSFAENTDTDPNQYSRVTFSGDGVGYSYIGYNSATNTWTGVTDSYTSARVLNAGIVTINGEVIHDSSAVLSGRTVYTLWNTSASARLTVDGQFGAGILDVNDNVLNPHTTYAIYNQFGKVNILNGALVDLTSDGTGSAAIYNAKTSSGSANVVTIGRDDIADGTIVRITASGAAGESYAVFNNEDLVISNSYIRALGTYSIALFNSTDGDATFTVTVNPNTYITDISGFSTTDAAANATAFSKLLFGITGGAYSLYNLNQFTMTYGGSVAAALFTSAVGGSPYFFNVPVMSLNGEVHTEAKASTSTNKTTTNLNGVTVFGDITNNGTALVTLTDVYLNGDVDNRGSNVFVTGSFRSSDFYFGFDINNYQEYHGQSTDWILVENNILSTAAAPGNIYFGTRADGNAAEVAFESTQNYQFYNFAGTMTILKFRGLSSEAKPVLIYNQGVFTLDGSTAISGKAANGSYDLYVSYWGAAGGASGISNSGIVNFDPNHYNTTYYIANQMTLTSLNIRNTRDASAAVTNVAGNLTINGGSLQGSYSGLDALVDIWEGGSFTNSDLKFYIETPVTILNQVELIAGGAYSIRNSGDLILNGTGVNSTTTNGTLLTNALDFTTSYSGAYTALFNATMTVYLNEYYTSQSNDTNDLYVYMYSGVQSYSQHFGSSTQSASSLVPARVTVSYYSGGDVYSKTDFDLTTPAQTYTRTSSSVTYTNWHYGNFAVVANATLDHVAFYASASTSTNTAIMNWGNLEITGINADSNYQFTGFTVSIDNGYHTYWATDYAIANPLGHEPEYASGFFAAVAQYFTVKGDVEVGFDLQATTILTNYNSYDKSELTLRGVFDATSKYDYDGRILVSGSRYVVFSGKTLTLVNFSVLATGSDAIYNAGMLHIFNGVEQTDSSQPNYGSWIGGSNASIQATGNTGIVNNGSVFMVNGAVLNSNIGILHMASAGYLAIVNSTIANNTSWGIVSNRTAPTSSNQFNFAVVDSTIVGNGNGIQINNGQLDLVNSIVLNYGGTDISNTSRLNPSPGMVDSNIFCTDPSKMIDTMMGVYGRIITVSTSPQDGNVYGLAENSTALSGGIVFSYSIDSNGSPTDFYYGSNTGSIAVTWDKLGNTRVSGSDIAIGSCVEAGTPVVTVKVMTLIDENNDDTVYSLREVINWLQSSENTNKDIVVIFDWAALVAEQSDPSLWVFNLDASLGSLALNGTNAAGITEITINGQYTDAVSGQTYNVTVNGDALASSVFGVDGMNMTLSNIAVDGSGTTATAVAVNGAAVNLSNNAELVLDGGVTMTGGNTIGLGGAVYLGAGSVLTLQNTGNAFTGNTAGAGGAIYNLGTVNVVSTASVTVTGNIATQNGGAVYNAGAFTVNTGSTLSFSTNSAANGGAVYNADTFTVNTGSTVSFSGNSATQNGGAVYNTDTFTADTGSTLSFSGNSAANGGAVYNTGTFTVSATTATFTGNTADDGAGGGSGGAIYNEAGTLAVSGTFTGNSAVNGGAIDMAGGTGVVSRGYFVSNSATLGGAVYVEGGSIGLTQSALMFNRAGVDGTAVYVADGRFDAVNTTLAKNGIDQNDPTNTDVDISAIYAADAAQLYLADSTVADNSSGISLAGNAGAKVLVNSIVLNTSGTNLTGSFTNAGMNSYMTNYVGDTSAERMLIFGANELVVDSTSAYYGTISLSSSTSNPAITGGALVALDNGDYYYSTNGTIWYSVIGDSETTLSVSAVIFDTDQVGGSRTLESTYSIGAVVTGYVPPPSSIIVDTLLDTVDSTDGKTSLREAIAAVISGAGDGITITFDWNALIAEAGGNDLDISLVLGAFQDISTSITIDAMTDKPAGVNITVDGSSVTTGSVFTVDGNAVFTVNGLNMIGAQNTGGEGGAVAVYSGKLILNDLSISGGSAFLGGAVFLIGDSSLTANNVTFSSNSAWLGGAVFLGGSSSLTATNVTFSSNSASYGGAVGNLSGSVSLANVRFSGNTAGSNGGAIYNFGNATVGAGTFVDNVAADLGGAIINFGTIAVNASSFTGNTAGDGAAIYSIGSADLVNFSFVSNTASNGSIITMDGVDASLYMNNGSLRGNIGNHLIDSTGKVALLTTTTAFNTTASSVLNTASLDLVNSSITGSTTDSSALIRATTALQIANSIVVGNTADVQAVDASGAGKFYTAYSIFSGNAAQLANASVNVENLTGYSFGAVFGNGQVNSFGQLVLPSNSPAAMGVWTTYNRTTGDVYYSTRPEGVWTVGYNVNNVAWNYLGPGNLMGGFSLSNLVVGNGYPSVGAYWLNNSTTSLPDFGPGVNTDFSDPSYNADIQDWGYNSVVNAFMSGTNLYLTLGSELPMGWIGNLSRQLFGAPYAEMDSFSVFGGRGDIGEVPSGENDIGISVNGALSDDFTRFEETPYHSDGTPLTGEEIELIRSSALRGSVEEEAIPTLSETLGERVLAAFRSADIFKDSFDKALDQLLGADA